MKKKLLTLIGMTLCLGFGLQAKNPIPNDPELRTDTLANGLTYYIRHNNSPEGRVDFFIAQRVGSVNEEDNQQGLAHFLEHMCFNGTEHFPGNSLISYLEGLGVKFGANLNAYTSTDETVYNICEVPATRQSALDSCLLILRDWSCGLTLDPTEIDKERGVIKGEWRQRNGSASSRLLQKSLPNVYPGSKYGHRMPIGSMDIVDNFKPQELRDYYEKWYKPENQAVIVVGDIDPRRTEVKIREIFGSIPRSAVSAKSPVYPVADNEKVIVSVESDPEQANSMIQLYIKHPDLSLADKKTIDLLRERYIGAIAGQMLAERFDEIETGPGSPFSNLGTGDLKFLLSKSPRAWLIRANAYPGKENECIRVYAEEIRRAARYGFLQTELDRAKLDYRSTLDSRYANRDKIDNTAYAKTYAKHFIEGGSLPAEEPYYKMMKGVMSSVKLDDINNWFRNVVGDGERNAVVMAYLPSTVTGVTTETLRDAFTSVDDSKLTAYIDKGVDKPILASEPQAGRIVKEEKLDKFGAKVWTLNNGARVFVRKNDDKPDQIVIQAFSPGGISQEYDVKYSPDYRLLNDVLAVSAFGGHTSSDLRKLLVGKKANVKMAVENMEDQMAVTTSPADLQTALQVLHLKASSPEKDNQAFATLINNQKMKLNSHASNPTFEMGDSIHANVYGHHPLGLKLSREDLDRVDYDHIINLTKGRFANMSDFSFFITGNFDEDSLRNGVERYIASLPGSGVTEHPRDIGYRYTQGRNKHVYERKMETPTAITYSLYTGDSSYDIPTLVNSKALGQILSAKLREDIRENKGWTYGVKTHIGLNAGMNGDDTPKFLMPVYIKVEPGREEDCLKVVDETVAKLSEPGFITEEEVAKVRNYLAKNMSDADTDNYYWASILHAYDKFGEDMHTMHIDEINALTPARLTEFARNLLKDCNLTQMIMKPEK